jgi:hypothetical protein
MITDAKYLVITDSNFKHAESMDIPPNWEIHVFPGAKLAHASKLISSAITHVNTTDVIISVGINNRTCQYAGSTQKDILSIKNISVKRDLKCHFLGISYSRSLPPVECRNLADLNKGASNMFKHGYIQPLSKVGLDPNDSYRIHYNRDTLNLILENIKVHLANYLN